MKTLKYSNENIISIIGRPNVGKSTLFNRLIGERRAIESKEPGTTRDRLYGDVCWCGKKFTLIDTAGFGGEREPELFGTVNSGIDLAIQQSDQILFVVDAKEEPKEQDYLLSRILRKNNIPVILVINKADGRFDKICINQYKRLGFDRIIFVSAISGQNSGDLLDEIVKTINLKDEDNKQKSKVINLAIIGKPNVGKSTLLNNLVGENRMIVSKVAGTTRDSQNFRISHKGKIINLIDTAGLRKKSRIAKDSVESYSILRALLAIKKSDLVIYLASMDEDFSSFEANLILDAKELGKSIVVAINKLDTVQKENRKEQMSRVITLLQDRLNFMPYLPVIFISAKDKINLKKLLDQVLLVYGERNKQCEQKVVNKILQNAKDTNSQISYIHKLSFERSNPTVFKIKSARNRKMHFSHLRFLENKIRDVYPFIGTPIFIDQDKNK